MRSEEEFPCHKQGWGRAVGPPDCLETDKDGQQSSKSGNSTCEKKAVTCEETHNSQTKSLPAEGSASDIRRDSGQLEPELETSRDRLHQL